MWGSSDEEEVENPNPEHCSTSHMNKPEQKEQEEEDGITKICISSGSTLNELVMNMNNSDTSSSDEVLIEEGKASKDLLPPCKRARARTLSSSKGEDDVITTETGRKVYTKGRPPWYDRAGKRLKKSYLIGICGGSASGKTTVAKKIIEKLEMPWVTVLSMDSFYKVLNEEQHQLAAEHEYNFDHPDAFDFDLVYQTLLRLRDGKSVEVPVYDFTTHRRSKNPKLMYGADILIFEGILAFHKPEIAELMDMKVFVDTDSDTRLARRLERDIAERGRDVAGVLQQYIKHVKPAFDSFIATAMKIADIIVPRGGENLVAIDLIVRQIKNQLTERGYYAATTGPHAPRPLPPDPMLTSVDFSKTTEFVLHDGRWHHSQNGELGAEICAQLPPLLHVVQCEAANGLNRIIRGKERKTSREEFRKLSAQIMPTIIERAVFYMTNKFKMDSGYCRSKPNSNVLNGLRFCGVTIMRAEETLLENSLRSVIMNCKLGKILIRTNERSLEPELHFLRLPKNISQYKILLMDTTVRTGAAAMMAIRILLDHDVSEQDIIFCSVLMADEGAASLAYAFPKVMMMTAAVHSKYTEPFTNANKPVFDNFLYVGSEAVELITTDDEEEELMDYVMREQRKLVCTD